MTDAEKAEVLDVLVKHIAILNAKPLKILTVDEDFLRTRKGYGIENEVTFVQIDMSINFDMEVDKEKSEIVMRYFEENVAGFERPDLSPTYPPKKVYIEEPFFEDLQND